MKYIIPGAVTIGVGLIVLLSYLIPDRVLIAARLALVDWTVVLAGLAVLVGVLNLLLVHVRRIQSAHAGRFYSFLTILAVLFMLGVGALESYRTGAPALYQKASLTGVLFNGVIMASLAALASLVMFFLVVSAVRMLKAKPGGWSVLFLLAVLVSLVGWIPLSLMSPVNDFRQWLVNVPVSAGTRGILLGIALGTLVIGLRVLVGAERPYKD